MPAPTISRLDLSPTGQGFTVKGRAFSVADVVHLDLDYTQVTQTTNLVEVGRGTCLELRLLFRSGMEARLTSNETTIIHGWNRDRKQEIQQLLAWHRELSESTFEQRLHGYLAELKQRGYFTHEDCCFIPGQGVKFKGRLLQWESTKFVKIGRTVHLETQSSPLLAKIARDFAPRKSPQFETVRDSDVIFHLLHACFGISWNCSG